MNTSIYMYNTLNPKPHNGGLTVNLITFEGEQGFIISEIYRWTKRRKKQLLTKKFF